jgi:predicted esterase
LLLHFQTFLKMNHHKIKIEKTAHYYTRGLVNPKTKYLWFVTHGYGQLANSIIRKFEGFDETEHVVIAPEGLNRFYWDLRKGIVGASWMTKHDRLDEIDDYTHFLNQIFNQYTSELFPDGKVFLLGFSQGCATQIRWILRGLPHFHHLVMWGGILPEDIDYQPFMNYFNDKKLHFVCGNDDEYLNEERINWNIDFAKKQGFDMSYHPFVGKHEILTEELAKVFEIMR